MAYVAITSLVNTIQQSMQLTGCNFQSFYEKLESLRAKMEKPWKATDDLEALTSLEAEITELACRAGDMVDSESRKVFSGKTPISRRIVSISMENSYTPFYPPLLLPPPHAFPLYLKKLAFRGTYLQCKDLSIVGKFPKLESLKLEGNAFTGEEWEVVDEGNDTGEPVVITFRALNNYFSKVAGISAEQIQQDMQDNYGTSVACISASKLYKLRLKLDISFIELANQWSTLRNERKL